MFQDLMVKNVKRYMKQQKKDVFSDCVADFVPVTYILPQVRHAKTYIMEQLILAPLGQKRYIFG